MSKPAARVLSGTNLAERFRRVRDATERLVAPLSAEDCQVQSMPDVSPAKWHLAHTTWFFETFVVRPHVKGHQWFDESFTHLFNSYYNAVGSQFPRPDRGLLTRPSLELVRAYRRAVDEQVVALLESDGLPADDHRVLETGLNHEQQHQELLLMDIKHVLFCNPNFPAYHDVASGTAATSAPEQAWVGFPEGLRQVGHEGGGFAFDNEEPRHRVYVQPFRLASRLVTNGEYLAFVRDGGYDNPLIWLSDGWDAVRRGAWRAPIYWVERDGEWFEFTLGGLAPLNPNAPVCHLSYYEADAFAEWAGARLPRESEWEVAAAERPVEGRFVEDERLHPASADGDEVPTQLFGDCWEWTSSAYGPYPGYRQPEGALGEYNGKFMCGQYVMRGGSCVTPASHIRATYRNFFYPHMRWQFGGVRLARD